MTADEAAVERVRAFGREVPMATAEDTVITKLRWASLANRSKDATVVTNCLNQRLASRALASPA